MNKALMFFTALLVVSPAIAAEQNTTESLSPLEKQEREEAGKKVSSLIAEARVLLDQIALENESQCMKAFGSKDFCKCISGRLPRGINLPQYVVIVGQTKSELNYDKLSVEDKGIVDTSRKARDACVQ